MPPEAFRNTFSSFSSHHAPLQTLSVQLIPALPASSDPALLKTKPSPPLPLTYFLFVIFLFYFLYPSPLPALNRASFSPLSAHFQSSHTQRGTTRFHDFCNLVTHISRVRALICRLAEPISSILLILFANRRILDTKGKLIPVLALGSYISYNFITQHSLCIFYFLFLLSRVGFSLLQGRSIPDSARYYSYLLFPPIFASCLDSTVARFPKDSQYFPWPPPAFSPAIHSSLPALLYPSALVSLACLVSCLEPCGLACLEPSNSLISV